MCQAKLSKFFSYCHAIYAFLIRRQTIQHAITAHFWLKSVETPLQMEVMVLIRQNKRMLNGLGR